MSGRALLKPSAASLRIGGFTRLSTCDWPGELAATIFCQGCGWDCVYCHNPGLRPALASGLIAWDEVVGFLYARRGLLDAVVFTGGEASLQPALLSAIEQVRNLGFRIGLHTAGMHPAKLQALLPLVDWVGFDVKASFYNYASTTQVAGSGKQAHESLRLLLESNIDHEVRTTVHPSLLPLADLLALKAELLAEGVRHYAVQRFRTEGVHSAFLATAPAASAYELPADFGAGFKSFVLR